MALISDAQAKSSLLQKHTTAAIMSSCPSAKSEAEAGKAEVGKAGYQLLSRATCLQQ